MCTCGLLTQRVGPVKSGHSHHYHLVKIELVLAMIWLKQNAHLVLNNNLTCSQNIQIL
jgi:hypothetical protein